MKERILDSVPVDVAEKVPQVFERPAPISASAQHRPAPRNAWDPERFGWEQICGLVRQVFSSNVPVPVRQVVFSAVDHGTDIHALCMRVAESLARETRQRIAVAGQTPLSESGETIHRVASGRIGEQGKSPFRQVPLRVRSNVWLLPRDEGGEDGVSMASIQQHLSDIRREFEYSIVEAPPASDSDEPMAMAQFADGIILVLSARHTRKATALKIKESLVAAEARLLGTVLSDREFPIPEKIYRRL